MRVRCHLADLLSLLEESFTTTSLVLDFLFSVVFVHYVRVFHCCCAIMRPTESASQRTQTEMKKRQRVPNFNSMLRSCCRRGSQNELLGVVIAARPQQQKTRTVSLRFGGVRKCWSGMVVIASMLLLSVARGCWSDSSLPPLLFTSAGLQLEELERGALLLIQSRSFPLSQDPLRTTCGLHDLVVAKKPRRSDTRHAEVEFPTARSPINKPTQNIRVLLLRGSHPPSLLPPPTASSSNSNCCCHTRRTQEWKQNYSATRSIREELFWIFLILSSSYERRAQVFQVVVLPL